MERISLEDMLLDGVLGLIAENWWLILLAAVIVLIGTFINKSGSRRSRLIGNSSESVRRSYSTISGKAFVTDGDGLRVARQEVRIFGIDAPEWNQLAKDSNGQWFNHGRVVKSALIKEIGGEYVRVVVEDTDKFGRLLGTVSFRGRDIGEWMVREGHAIAAYSDRYKRVELEARKARRGMWANEHNFDPRNHRHR